MAKPETVHNQCIKPHFCHPHEISMQPACEKRACSSDIIRQYRLQNYVSDKKSNLTDRCLFHQLARAFLDQSKLSASILYCFWILLYQSKSSFFCHIDSADRKYHDIKNNDFQNYIHAFHPPSSTSLSPNRIHARVNQLFFSKINFIKQIRLRF